MIQIYDQGNEALKAYHQYWDCYSNGDMEGFAAMLDEEFELIGTSETEVAHSKAEGLEFYNAQMFETVGKVDNRNRIISVKPINDLVLINETCDIYVLVEAEWTFYSKIRISTLLRETKSGWKVIQQHGSFPDMRVQEGETLAIEKITKENIELRDAIKRRTAELEIKNRELEIEAALERVRSRSMAMHDSSDLSAVVFAMFTELVRLDAQLDRCLILIVNPQTLGITWYLTGKEGLLSNNGFYIPDNEHPSHQAYLDGWRTKRKKWNYYLAGEEKRNWDAFGFTQTELVQLPEFIKTDMAAVEAIHLTISSDDFGCLIASSLSPLSEAHAGIVERFTIVFNQTYTRFLDLKKAEAQAKAAQIELALERIRARAMSMQYSDHLKDVIEVIGQQLHKMGLFFDYVNFIVGDTTDGFDTWNVSFAQANPVQFFIPLINNRVFKETTQAKKDGLDFIAYTLTREETFHFITNLITNGILKHLPEEALQKRLQSKGMSVSSVVLNEVVLSMANYSAIPYTDEENLILKRFGNAFQQAFTRFLDLQKVEAQAKEARIEVALEKVRSRTMAMQSSNELQETAAVLFEEFKKLGTEEIYQVTIGTYNEEEQLIDFRVTDWAGSGQLEQRTFQLDMNEPSLVQPAIAAWKEGKKSAVFDLTGDRLQGWLNYRNQISGITMNSRDTGGRRIISGAYFSKGHLSLSSPLPLAQETIKTLERFASVFDGTYTRFLDLQRAEVQALEAIKRASVDRVRAEIASMRTTADLERIQPLIWNELKTLGVPFIRCGVFIMIEEKQEVQAFLSTPDGKSIAAFHLPYHATEQTKQIVAHWQQRQIFKDHMDEAAFVEYTKTLVQQGAVPADEKYVTENRPTDLHLHFLPFLQGMLYAGNDAPLKDDELQLVQNLADAFATAYARYQDFNKLELAKAAVETAMTELKATQTQLVQQEKLASLGQLTAGIAHEIKNPLNFVNNFTEVSLELLEETLEEMLKNDEKKDITLINQNLEDIQSNLKKVYDHGTRANSIVNSMLLHSRSGGGAPQPTLLNDFILEYSNLAFHGMRAGNQPIDVQIMLDLDEKVKEVPVIVEDFSRVILNICNNAFDAMREKKKKYEVDNTKNEVRNTKNEVRNTKYEIENTKRRPEPAEGYEVGEDGAGNYVPKLSIQTRLEKGKVQIQFEDNGPGIPDEIKDKILQPFFTTKKGTEGTGLGLSITHDIIKAHGGTLEIESVVGQYSKFIITLI